MFNFFDEIKKKIADKTDVLNEFNIVNVSGRALYVEGHMGLTVISSQAVVFKTKKGRIVVEGENLALSELTENTILLRGKIVKVESV